MAYRCAPQADKSAVRQSIGRLRGLTACLGLVTAAALLVAMGDHIPVDHVPPGGEVVGAAILVFEIVGMLPDIVAHYREHAVHQRAVLVGCRDNLELATPVEHEPCPS